MLRVGAFCVGGKHRSVGFVEELERKGWPPEWEVRIRHRDVHASRNEAVNGTLDENNNVACIANVNSARSEPEAANFFCIRRR